MAFGSKAKGVYAIAVTPFLDDGSLDLASLDRLVDYYVECGCTGLTILGILGEAAKLDAAESEEVVRRVIARSDLPTVVGVSAPGFAAMRRLALTSMDLGAAGVMIAPPSNVRSDDQIRTYFDQVVEAIGSDVPWVLQDYPLTTTVFIAPRVIRDIVERHPSCVMLKHEDWPGLEKITELRKWQRDGTLRPISILCGNGGLFLDFEMSRGADGAMSGYAYTDALVEIVRKSAAGDRDGAHELFDAHLPLIRYEHQQGVGLSVRKYLLQRRGVIASGKLRKPSANFTAASRSEVDYLLSRLSRRDKRASDVGHD